ncbi:MAG: ATP-binding cassette domain-containing protein [Alphaproteobacteria bacterium GM202ARS2]|nr:ATP-binding cassette domain-containing protein [Alphaproteobacteria bacterium GM202ARS2]
MTIPSQDMPLYERESRHDGLHLRPLARLLTMTFRYWGRLIAASLALIVASGLVLATGPLIKEFVDGDLAKTTSFITVLVVIFLFMAAIGVSSSLRLYFVGWIGERVVANLRKSVYDHIIKQSPSFFELNHSGAILSRLTTDSGIIQTLVGTTSSVAIRHTLILVGSIFIMFYSNVYLASVALITAPTTVLLLYALGRRVRTLSRKSQDRIADMSAYAEESVRGIRTLQAYSHQSIDKQRFDSHVEVAFQTATSRLKMRAFMVALVMVGVFMLVSSLLYMGTLEVKHGNLTLGELVQFLVMALLAGGSTAALAESFGEILRATGAAERMFEILDSTIDITSPDNPRPLTHPIQADIQCQNLSFIYPHGKGKKALDDITLSIDNGEKLAIVGPSGAGKSTLFQLLMRFYDPQQGTITLNGNDIRSYNVNELRAAYAFVSQDPIIFAASARENIAYARPDASEADIEQAADDAAILDVILSLPERFDSYLGQGGILLSGGERQRIALARAFLSKPAILLLDEATSAVDSAREQQIQQAVDKLSAQCTTIIIAHRLATVMGADRILVLDQGKIIAQGRHQELLKTCDLYARLAEMQLQKSP